MNSWMRCCWSASLLMMVWATAGNQAAAGPIPPMMLPTPKVESLSGQFVISVSRDYSTYESDIPRGAQATALRIEPPLLSVTAERIKRAVWTTFGVPDGARWQGNIYLVVHPLRHWGEATRIAAEAGVRGWNYRVDLQDALPQDQFVRVMTSAVLFELAEHGAKNPPHSPELPAWLVDGLVQRMLTDELQNLVVAAPKGLLNGLPEGREDAQRHGGTRMVAAHRILQQNAPLTFTQMSWPTADQLAGRDGGVYLASAEVFVSELLDMPQGRKQLYDFLTRLSWCENWQTAFQSAYQAEFARPLDVEKWWSLQAINFAAQEPGPTWTPDASRRKLNEILQVPVEIRANSNSLPSHAELTLQQALLKVSFDQQDAVLSARLRELGLVRLRLAAPLADLAESYREVLADYLGQRIDVRVSRSGRSARTKTGIPATIRKLDRLDALRREIEAKIKPDKPVLPQN